MVTRIEAVLMIAVGIIALPHDLDAQLACQPTPIFSRCELVFEMDEAEAKAHPNPYRSVTLQGEFRSPKHRTFLMPGFWDGQRRFVIRFAPVDVGDWEFRITSNVARWNGQQGKLTATAASVPGFIQRANVHHWQNTESMLAHLWMGDTVYDLAVLKPEDFRRVVDARASQKFTHIRGLLLGNDAFAPKVFGKGDSPDAAFFRELDSRVAYMNEK
ncbi:MAG TPA: DUF5060 domain-containing protein, partial [Bryobacteraceae bacterium]|nr:DUF5060 domain-containing protein [Bryobacteraceae bacterium]